MFDRKLSSAKSELEVVRTKLIAQLESHTGDSDEYKKIMHHVETLSNLIDNSRPKKLDVNTVVVVLGNVGIAGMVLWHERDNVVTTKIFPFLSKPKG